MFEKTFETSATPHIVVVSCRGSLRVRGETEERVRLLVEERDGEVRVEQEGDTLTMTIPGDGTLLCPSGTFLTVDQVAGSLRVGDLGGEVTVGSVHGNARLERVGSLRVERTLGNLWVRSVDGELTAEALQGNVTIREVRGAATLEKVAGNLVAEELQGGLSAERVHGNARLGPEFAAGSQYCLQASGNLDLELPSDADVNLTLRARGRIQSDVAGLTLERGKGEAKVTLGKGRAVVEADVRGSIVLRSPDSKYTSSLERDLDQLGATIEHRISEKMADLAARLESSLAGLETEPIRRRVETAKERARRQAEHAAERARMRAERAERRWRRASGKGPQVKPDAVSSEERLHVLRMVEQGRLTPDQAAELLSALEGS